MIILIFWHQKDYMGMQSNIEIMVNHAVVLQSYLGKDLQLIETGENIEVMKIFSLRSKKKQIG